MIASALHPCRLSRQRRKRRGIVVDLGRELCGACFGRELLAYRPQARVLGAMWAEQIARLPEYRGREHWPMTGKVQEIVRRKVQQLAHDPRLHEELAQDCIAGAVAWWEGHAARR